MIFFSVVFISFPFIALVFMYCSSTLQASKGRRGRKQVCVLLEEMLIQPYAELLTNGIETILTEWMETNATDSVLTYILLR